MISAGSYFWKRTPFLKLLPALMVGILLQWYAPLDPGTWSILLISGILTTILFFFIPFFNRFRLSVIAGSATALSFIATGALLIYYNDIRNNKNWLGDHYKEKDGLVVTLNEPLVEKSKSFKASASISYLVQHEKFIPVRGTCIIYFKKDSMLPGVGYGSCIVFQKPLQAIRNTGNPAGFDYKRYCLFQGITHQVFLQPGEFQRIGNQEKWFPEFLNRSRDKILNCLRKNIRSDKECGLAEALLIGYKNDLERSLVQSYTNTGVVHIIAISGLHLGLIYWLLVALSKPLQRSRRLKWLRPLCIISFLWLFSFLAGAQPSVLRSALMFTCIVAGESLSRKTSIYNSLALSAFILLCVDPFWLWDVGFQLSYAAVLSIIIFLKPIYNWFYIKNHILDFIWKLNAITLAAQVLTVPLSLYHFHQFPVYFLLTNLIAVPLSSIILLGEILLCSIAWIPGPALLVGKLLTWMIRLMNAWIEKIESLPYAVWAGIQMDLLQTLLLFAVVTGLSCWLIEKIKMGLVSGLFALMICMLIRSYSFIKRGQQQKIVVYNIPRTRAIDCIDGRNYFFAGDTGLVNNELTRNFHLRPTRTLFRVSPVSLENLSRSGNYIQFASKRILLLDSAIYYTRGSEKPVIDLLIISGKPRLNIPRLVNTISIRQIVFDSSVPAWKIVNWKKECDALHIPSHDVSTEGAFVMNLR